MCTMKTYKNAYLLGEMLRKANVLLRKQEAEELRALGINLYSAEEQKDINDKQNQTVKSNDSLHSKIYVKDRNAIYHSDLIICCAEESAVGSMNEIGGVATFNWFHENVTDIMNNPRLSAEEKVALTQAFLEEHPHKTVYCHVDDLRVTDLPETRWNRSYYINQFLRGCCVSAMNYYGADATEEGVRDIMSWTDVIEQLKRDMADEDENDDFEDEEEIEEYEPYDDTQVEEIVFEAVLDSESRF